MQHIRITIQFNHYTEFTFEDMQNFNHLCEAITNVLRVKSPYSIRDTEEFISIATEDEPYHFYRLIWVKVGEIAKEEHLKIESLTRETLRIMTFPTQEYFLQFGTTPN